MRTIDDIWKEAELDEDSIPLHDSMNQHKYELAYLRHGCRITKDIETGKIVIYNAYNSGDEYELLPPDQYIHFGERGWIQGARVAHRNVIQSMILQKQHALSMAQFKGKPSTSKKILSQIDELEKRKKQITNLIAI